MLGELVPCGGGTPIPLVKPMLVVGRQEYCDVVLAHGAVSSRHCLLEFLDGHWHVRDLGSRNGTLVNGTVCQQQRLEPGDVLAVANLRFFVDYSLPAPPRAEPAADRQNVPLRRAGIAFGEVPPPEAVAGRKSSRTGLPLGELVPCGGGDPIALRKPLLLVGRDPKNDIVLPCGTVSSRHCELEYTNGYWWVRDLGSRNGTKIDGADCQNSCIAPGKILSISKHRYRIDYLPPPADAKANPSKNSKSPSFFRALLERAGLAKGEEVGPPAHPTPPETMKPPETERAPMLPDTAPVDVAPADAAPSAPLSASPPSGEGPTSPRRPTN
jgi:adenylate cyclase